MLGSTLVAALSLLTGQDGFLPTADHRWAFDGMALAKRERILVQYPDHHGRGRPQSRYEVVVALHASAANHLNRLEAFLESPSGDLERAALLRSAALLPVYRQAQRDFRREFHRLGIDDDFGQSRIAALTRQVDATSEARHRPFRDVPVGHWAAKAVGDLRALGLIDGYPDGRFRP